MRELKFRIWNGAEMVYDVTVGKFGVFYVNQTNNGLDPKDSASITPFTTKYPEGTPIMQFTGLLDKNGKEIYEGDIMDLRPDENSKVWHRVIEWDTAAFHCKQIHGKANHPLHFHKHSPDREWVVISNIYEHPELLKDTV